jgi:beta-1,4-mannosyltransferase
VAVAPYLDGLNAYQRIINAELERRGVKPEAAPGIKSAWVRSGAGGAQAVHLHWLEFLYGARGPWPIRRVLTEKRALALVAGLRALRQSPVRLVWTVHNLRPHETYSPRLVEWTTRAAFEAADALVVHSSHAAARLREMDAPKSPIVILPHPHYVGATPPPRLGREIVRARLGLVEADHLHLAFGQVRAYKGVLELVRTIASSRDPHAHVLVAGIPVDPQVSRAVRKEAASDRRIHLLLEGIPDEDVADLHAAADSGVFNYSDVFSSGALLMALSHGLAVVGPAGTTVGEVAGTQASTSFAPGQLGEALAQERRKPRRSEAAFAAAERCSVVAHVDGLLPHLLGPC